MRTLSRTRLASKSRGDGPEGITRLSERSDFWQGIARAQTPLSFGHDPVSGELLDGSRGRLLALPFAPQILRKLGCNILCLLATNPRNIRYYTLRCRGFYALIHPCIGACARVKGETLLPRASENYPSRRLGE